jgi:uncharacterized protein (DUF3084 family)
VAGLEERVAFLEGRVVEHSHMLDGIREAIVHLEQRMDRRFELIEQRFTGLDSRFVSIDQRFEAIDRRFAAIDQRFAAIDQRFAVVDQRLSALDMRIDGLDAKMSRQFMWLVGIQVTTLVAIVAALVAR